MLSPPKKVKTKKKKLTPPTLHKGNPFQYRDWKFSKFLPKITFKWVQTVKSTKKYSDSLELSHNSYCTLPNSNRTVPISNILLIFLLRFIGSIRCTVLSYNHIKLKINFYFLRFLKKNTIGLILSNFIVFLKKKLFFKSVIV